MKDQLDINPQTKVGEVLDTYPQLEEVLISISPSFAKLKNPILRRTVARVVSLRQAAEMGNVDIGSLIQQLRKAAGLNNTEIRLTEDFNRNAEAYTEYDFENNAIAVTFDAIDIINTGNSPMKEILAKAELLHEGKTLELITPFVPQPIIELLVAKGYTCKYKKEGEKVYTYIKKK